MRSLRLWLILALVPWLAGAACPAIYSEQPLGDVGVLKPEELNGLWLFLDKESGVGTISVIDAANGVIALHHEHSCGSLPPSHPKDLLVQLRSRRSANGKQWYFFSKQNIASRDQVSSLAKPTPPFEYTQFLLRTNKGVVLGYEVVEDRFKSLVEKGALPGRIEGGKVILGPLNPEHYDILLSEEHPLVKWQSVKIVFMMKLPPELDPCKKGDQSK